MEYDDRLREKDNIIRHYEVIKTYLEIFHRTKYTPILTALNQIKTTSLFLWKYSV